MEYRFMAKRTRTRRRVSHRRGGNWLDGMNSPTQSRATNRQLSVSLRDFPVPESRVNPAEIEGSIKRKLNPSQHEISGIVAQPITPFATGTGIDGDTTRIAERVPKPGPTGPRYRNGAAVPASDWEMILTALFKLPPKAATSLLVTAEARLRQRKADAKSRAARDRHAYDRIRASLLRDRLLTGNATTDAALVFARENGRSPATEGDQRS